jgi:hypothetical protein
MKLFALLWLLLGTSLILGTERWKNPVISCTLKENEDPVRQFPYSDDVGMAAGLQKFCNRMQDRFSQSGLSAAEAKEVYAALFAGKWLREGSYGMPSPDLPPTKPLTLVDYKKRIALRKVDDNSYEVYYSYLNCGTNYEYAQVWIVDGKISRQERLEAWSGLYPC